MRCSSKCQKIYEMDFDHEGLVGRRLCAFPSSFSFLHIGFSFLLELFAPFFMLKSYCFVSLSHSRFCFRSIFFYLLFLFIYFVSIRFIIRHKCLVCVCMLRGIFIVYFEKVRFKSTYSFRSSFFLHYFPLEKMKFILRIRSFCSRNSVVLFFRLLFFYLSIIKREVQIVDGVL